jgi:hypothetical protein
VSQLQFQSYANAQGIEPEYNPQGQLNPLYAPSAWRGNNRMDEWKKWGDNGYNQQTQYSTLPSATARDFGTNIGTGQPITQSHMDAYNSQTPGWDVNGDNNINPDEWATWQLGREGMGAGGYTQENLARGRDSGTLNADNQTAINSLYGNLYGAPQTGGGLPMNGYNPNNAETFTEAVNRSYGGYGGSSRYNSGRIPSTDGELPLDFGYDPNRDIGSSPITNGPTTQSGGYDGGGINPNGMYSNPQLGPAPIGGQTPTAGQPQYNSYQTGNSGNGDPMPQYGLSGFESAITSGLGASAGALGSGTRMAQDSMTSGLENTQNILAAGGTAAANQIDSGYQIGRDQLQTGIDSFNPYSQSGANAQQRQADLSGANGFEAQAAAFDTFNESPGQQYLREQAEKSLLRNTSAIGGLGGGRVRQELQRQAVGLAAQDYQNQFSNLGEISNRGVDSVTNQANLLRDQSSLSQQGSRNIADIIGGVASGSAAATSGTAAALASLYQNTGQGMSNLYGGAATQIAGARQQAGRDIANAIDGTSSALSGLIDQQGTGLAELIGQDAANIANLLSSGATLTAAQQTTLATALANLSSRTGTNIGNAEIAAGRAEAGGITGGAAAVNTGLGNINNTFGGS